MRARVPVEGPRPHRDLATGRTRVRATMRECNAPSFGVPRVPGLGRRRGACRGAASWRRGRSSPTGTGPDERTIRHVKRPHGICGQAAELRVYVVTETALR